MLQLNGTEPPTTGVPLAPAAPEARSTDPDAGDGHARARGEERPSVSLVYETPGLGRLDLRVERGPEGIVVSLGTSPHWHALAQGGAEDLRRALEAKLEAPAAVRVSPRREPFDAYA